MELTAEQIEEIKRRSWHHSIDFGNGLVSEGNVNCRGKVDKMGLPADLTGQAVLDVGTRDGGLAFEFERRGAAEVIANDVVPIDHFNFAFARECRASAVKFLSTDLYSLPFLRLPKFDVINYSGVIYHVSDPILSLMAMRELCREGGTIIVESAVLDNKVYKVDSGATENPHEMRPNPLEQVDNLLQYLPRGAVNSWVPSIDALAALCEDSGLEILDAHSWGSRVLFRTIPSKRPRFRCIYRAEMVAPLLGSADPVFA